MNLKLSSEAEVGVRADAHAHAQWIAAPGAPSIFGTPGMPIRPGIHGMHGVPGATETLGTLSTPGTPSLPGTPDETARRRSLAKYRKRAAGYDSTCGPTWTIREHTIAALDLQLGQRVLDVGCGTGLSLELLRQRVGDQGQVYGFDHSTEMLAQARERVAKAGWRNVTLFETPAQALRLPQPVDALLFHYTHDILRSHAALAGILACARPGAHIAIAGIKYFPRWLAPLNAWVYWKNHGYNGAPGELRSPWDRIAPRLADWRLVATQFGMGYIASGRLLAAAGPQGTR